MREVWVGSGWLIDLIEFEAFENFGSGARCLFWIEYGRSDRIGSDACWVEFGWAGFFA